MEDISPKTIAWFVAGIVGLTGWFLRLEFRVKANKTLSETKLKAVELKLDNHIVSSKEKHERIFDKLEKVEVSINEIKLSVALIAEHFKKE